MVILVALAASACGRIAFDASSSPTADAATSDGRVTTDAGSSDAGGGFDADTFDASVPPDAETSDAPGVVLPAPIHHWPFDEGTGTIAMDVVGPADLSLQNGAAWGAGRCGGALALDGMNGYAVASHGLGIGAITITAWVFYVGHGASNYGALVSEEDVGGNTLLVCYRSHGDMSDQMICAHSTTAPYARTESIIPLGRWVHLAMARSIDGLFTMYVDGALSGVPRQDGGAVRRGGTSIYVGARDALNDELDGFVDDVRVYERELSSSEIAAVFALGCP